MEQATWVDWLKQKALSSSERPSLTDKCSMIKEDSFGDLNKNVSHKLQAWVTLFREVLEGVAMLEEVRHWVQALGVVKPCQVSSSSFLPVPAWMCALGFLLWPPLLPSQPAMMDPYPSRTVSKINFSF